MVQVYSKRCRIESREVSPPLAEVQRQARLLGLRARQLHAETRSHGRRWGRGAAHIAPSCKHSLTRASWESNFKMFQAPKTQGEGAKCPNTGLQSAQTPHWERQQHRKQSALGCCFFRFPSLSVCLCWISSLSFVHEESSFRLRSRLHL